MHRLAASLLAVVATAALAGTSYAAEQRSSGTRAATLRPVTAELLAAEAEGLVDVRFIPNDSRSAQVIVTNRSERPLTLRLPETFAGVPVLAQMGMGMQGGGFAGAGIGAGAQSVGGAGGVQNQGMGIGQPMGGGFGGPCWVAREVYGVHDARWTAFRDWISTDAPLWLYESYLLHGEAVAAFIHDRPIAKTLVRWLMDQVVEGRVSRSGGGHLAVMPEDPGTITVKPGRRAVRTVGTVCIEYGKREPAPRIPYRMVPLTAAVSGADPRLSAVLQALVGGGYSQRAVQAAAWHITDGRTWEQLAAEKIDQAGGDPDIQFFSPADLLAARHLVAGVTERTAAPAAKTSASRFAD